MYDIIVLFYVNIWVSKVNIIYIYIYMVVSTNGVYPNSWMVYFMENPNLKWMI